MENMIKDRIVKKMIVTWSITIIILAVLGWIIIKLFGFPDVNFASADIFDWCLVVLFFVIFPALSLLLSCTERDAFLNRAVQAGKRGVNIFQKVSQHF